LSFKNVFEKPMIAQLNRRQGLRMGKLVSNAAERPYGLITTMSGWLRDQRQPGQAVHSPWKPIAQCVLSIAIACSRDNKSIWPVDIQPCYGRGHSSLVRFWQDHVRRLLSAADKAWSASDVPSQ